MCVVYYSMFLLCSYINLLCWVLIGVCLLDVQIIDVSMAKQITLVVQKLWIEIHCTMQQDINGWNEKLQKSLLILIH